MDGHDVAHRRRVEDERHGVDAPPASPADDAVVDPLVDARLALDGVGELPLDERGDVFEAVHATVVDELRRLELG